MGRYQLVKEERKNILGSYRSISKRNRDFKQGGKIGKIYAAILANMSTQSSSQRGLPTQQPLPCLCRGTLSTADLGVDPRALLSVGTEVNPFSREDGSQTSSS